MDELNAKVAFVTGGASGIGLGMAQAFLENGMRVVVADVRQDHLEEAAELLGEPERTLFLRLDVTDRAAMARAADAAEDAFGKVHLLCNNAGVGIMGSSKVVGYADWDWGVGVNLTGVFNGVHTFLPRMLAHGEGGHIVNTASISAVFPSGLIYGAAKAGVLAMSEALRIDLEHDGIGVTCLMPGPVKSNIHEVAKLRPGQFQETRLDSFEQELEKRSPSPDWMTPIEVGRLTVDAIRRNQLFVFTHKEFKRGVEERFAAILAGFPAGEVDEAQAGRLGFPVRRPLYAQIMNAGPASRR